MTQALTAANQREGTLIRGFTPASGEHWPALMIEIAHEDAGVCIACSEKAHGGGRWCPAPIPYGLLSDLKEMLDATRSFAKHRVPQDIVDLIQCLDRCTDRWGEDLIGYVVNRINEDRHISEAHSEAVLKFKALNEPLQEAYVKAVLGED